MSSSSQSSSGSVSARLITSNVSAVAPGRAARRRRLARKLATCCSRHARTRPRGRTGLRGLAGAAACGSVTLRADAGAGLRRLPGACGHARAASAIGSGRTIVVDQLAVIEHEYALVHALDQREIVTRHEHRGADLLELGEQPHDLGRQHRIEIAGRLVRDEDRRFRDDRARDADALLLAGRQRHRQRQFAREQADLVERGTHALGGLLAARARNLQRQRDVVERAAVHQQPVILKHHADTAANRRNAPR